MIALITEFLKQLTAQAMNLVLDTTSLNSREKRHGYYQPGPIAQRENNYYQQDKGQK